MAQNNQVIQNQFLVVDQRLLVVENAAVNTAQLLQAIQQQLQNMTQQMQHQNQAIQQVQQQQNQVVQQVQQMLQGQQVLLATFADNQGFTIIQKNIMFKKLNKFVSYEDQLNVLLNDEGQSSQFFPQTKAELISLSVHQVNENLTFYGLPLVGNKKQKIIAFSRFIGVE